MPALFNRFSALPGLLITSTTCCTLLYLHLSKYQSSENFLIWTWEFRTAVTILVQLLSQVLGIVYVHVVCALVRS
ncbi:hypothetical protein AA0116_g4 [Alternaria tenuissima]|nr:hypothetical protein AA0116_g4 [Alternaria tenuissima]